MRFEWFVAKRYFHGSRKDASFLSFIKIMAISGVAVGTAALLIALSIVHGFKSVIEEKILGFGNHISIVTYADTPIYKADTLVTWVKNISGVKDAQPVVLSQVMVQYTDNVEGTFIKGVPESGDLSDLKSYISNGVYNLSKDSTGYYGVIMGSKLARSLEADIGSLVTVYAINSNLSVSNIPEIQQFRLNGIYQTGIDKFDDVFMLINIERSRTLLKLDSPSASQVDLRVENVSKISEMEGILYQKLGFPYFTESIYYRYSNIFAWINLQEQTIPLVLGALIIVAAFNLIGTVLMMILERVKDIGIMKTFGVQNQRIRNIFLFEGIYVGFIGLIIGITLSLLFYWLQKSYNIIPLSEENYYMTTAPVEPHLVDFIWVSIVTMILCILASWLPAKIASGMKPLGVIRFGK